MRLLSFILVIIIGLMTLTPAPALYPHTGHAMVSIQAFDICHNAGSGISVDLPDFIHEGSHNPRPVLIVDVRGSSDPIFTPLLVSFRDERPPRAQVLPAV